MISLHFKQLAEMTDGSLLKAEYAERSFTGIALDSRTISAGQLFIAIRGDRYDGHDFMSQAAYRGAAGILFERELPSLDLPPNLAAVRVPDSHQAMLDLAGQYLRGSGARAVGITGSNGKTTTKEFTYSLLSNLENDVYRSPGNYNNLFGIPLALFSMPENTKIAILEMGISVRGEMSRLAALIEPQVIAITNISPTHLETLGSVAEVAREKLVVVRQAQEDVPVIINGDDLLLVSETKKVRSDYISFAIDNDADFRASAITRKADGNTEVVIENNRFIMPLFGRHQVYNLLAAYAIVRSLGYSFESIDTAAIKFTTSDWRGEMVTHREITFIADCYNANPDSVRSGLVSFAGYPATGRRVAVLGDMLELGAQEADFHRATGNNLALASSDLAILVGPLSKYTAEAAIKSGMNSERVLHFDTAAAAAEWMLDNLRPGDLVYLKGSRGIGLEEILTMFNDEAGS